MSNDANRSVSSVATSTLIPLNHRGVSGNSTDTTILLEITITATASVEVTLDDPDGASPVWVPLTDFTGKTATILGGLLYPVKAARINCTAYTSGVVNLHILQA